MNGDKYGVYRGPGTAAVFIATTGHICEEFTGADAVQDAARMAAAMNRNHGPVNVCKYPPLIQKETA